MQAITIILAFMAALAMTSPVEVDKRFRRSYYTEVEIITITDYVTVDSLPTGGKQFARPSHMGSYSALAVSSTTTPSTTEAAPTTTPVAQAAVSSSTVDPVAPSSQAPPPPASSSQAPPPSSSQAPAASPAPAAPSGSNAFQTQLLDAHNLHRANHSASPLTWDDDLASIAAQIAASCVYAHNTQAGGGGYGQNIAAGLTSDKMDVMVTDMMYNDEMMNYPQYGTDNPDMSNFESWGHFSQIVWQGTTSIGCAIQQCASLANVGGNTPPIFTVCNFKPPGNMAGSYHNVGAPLGQPMVTA